MPRPWFVQQLAQESREPPVQKRTPSSAVHRPARSEKIPTRSSRRSNHLIGGADSQRECNTPARSVLHRSWGELATSERERKRRDSPDGQSDSGGIAEPVAGRDGFFEEDKQGEADDPIEVHYTAEK